MTVSHLNSKIRLDNSTLYPVIFQKPQLSNPMHGFENPAAISLGWREGDAGGCGRECVMNKEVNISSEIKILHRYTSEEQVSEVGASLAMEQIPLDREDIELLKEYQESKDKEVVRQQILENYKEC